MQNSENDVLMKGLNSQQKLAWQALEESNEKLIRENGRLTDEIIRFSSRLFEAETKVKGTAYDLYD